jgi:hypothetical protein
MFLQGLLAASNLLHRTSELKIRCNIRDNNDPFVETLRGLKSDNFQSGIVTILWSLRRVFESQCGMWVPILRMRLYETSSRFAVGVEHTRTFTEKGHNAKHRSKFAVLSQVMVTVAR